MSERKPWKIIYMMATHDGIYLEAESQLGDVVGWNTYDWHVDQDELDRRCEVTFAMEKSA